MRENRGNFRRKISFLVLIFSFWGISGLKIFSLTSSSSSNLKFSLSTSFFIIIILISFLRYSHLIFLIMNSPQSSFAWLSYKIQNPTLQITMIILSIFTLLSILCLTPVSCINFLITKKNLFIESNSHYLTLIELQKQNAELIPTNISMQTTISSTIPSFNYYFDYFYYLTGQDVSCYQQSVKNQSYLFPCPFINSKNSQLRTTSFKTQQTNQSIEEIQDLSFYFIIDNTLFPYPIGAYSYNPINIDISILVNMELNSDYQTLSIRLIFINVTIFLIFIVIMIVLVYKTRELNKRMQNSKLSSSDKKRLNSIHQRESQDSEQEEHEQQKVRKMKISQHEYQSNDEDFKERDISVLQSKQLSLVFSRKGSAKRNSSLDQK